MKRFAFILAALLLFAACTKEEPQPQSQPTAAVSLAGTSWVGGFDGDFQGYPLTFTWRFDVLTDSTGEYHLDCVLAAHPQPSQEGPFRYTFDGSDGIVTAVGKGQTRIRATAADGSGQSSDHIIKVRQQPTEITLNADGTITGSKTGTWAVKEGTCYITINIGAEYKGVMVLQTLEPKNDQAPAFTALRSATGVTIWGYKYAE